MSKKYIGRKSRYSLIHLSTLKHGRLRCVLCQNVKPMYSCKCSPTLLCLRTVSCHCKSTWEDLDRTISGIYSGRLAGCHSNNCSSYYRKTEEVNYICKITNCIKYWQISPTFCFVLRNWFWILRSWTTQWKHLRKKSVTQVAKYTGFISDRFYCIFYF